MKKSPSDALKKNWATSDRRLRQHISRRKSAGTWDGTPYQSVFDAYLHQHYGISEATYNEILKRQHGRCAICHSKTFNRKGNGRFSVDHDHKTGKVRGLLCHKCNMALGYLNDDVKIAQKLLEYLQEKI